MKIKNHNLVKGYYTIDFNLGIKDICSGITDFDIIRKVAAFEICYKNKELKNVYSNWLNSWGNLLIDSVDYKILS